MTKAHIDIQVELDEKRMPTRIIWKADEALSDQENETKAMRLSIWDDKEQHTLRLELWTQALRIDEMKRFYIDMLGDMSQSILNATGDTFMSEKLRKISEDLATYHRSELNKTQLTDEPRNKPQPTNDPRNKPPDSTEEIPH